MIRLTRVRSEEAIQAKYRDEGKKDADRTLLLAVLEKLGGASTTVKFNATFWKNAKQQLKKESFNKCAYCEADTAVVAHGDVEHYRPKSEYWWLAYTYDNYLYACQICNQTYKSDNFPISGKAFPPPVIPPGATPASIETLLGKLSPDPLGKGAGITLAAYEAAHFAEQAHLLNPYLDDPATYFAYEADDVIGEVKLIPTEAKHAHIVKAAESYYGINRTELRSARYQVYRTFRIIKRFLNQMEPSDPDWQETSDTYKDMLSDEHLFAGMCRFF